MSILLHFTDPIDYHYCSPSLFTNRSSLASSSTSPSSLREISGFFFARLEKKNHQQYTTTVQNLFTYKTLQDVFSTDTGDPSVSIQLGFVPCMTSPSVDTLISKLDHWLSLLDSVRSSFQTQVSLLDSALSNLALNQQQVRQNLHSVQETIANQLAEVLGEISDLNLARNLLVTSLPSTEDYEGYEYIFRLSDHSTNLNHRAAYYQELSDLFDSIYNYLYCN